MFHYSILQLPMSNERCFMDVDYDKINLADYVHVFHFESDVEVSLENIFMKLNIDHPVGYRARSMSVSDVIIVKNEETKRRKIYVVDSIGFKEVKEIRS